MLTLEISVVITEVLKVFVSLLTTRQRGELSSPLLQVSEDGTLVSQVDVVVLVVMNEG